MEITNKYLGEDKITRLLFKFSLPCILGLLIGALYNIGESVGKIDYKQYGTIFTVRPYVIYTDINGVEKVVYGDPINASVFDVVYDIREKANAQEDDLKAANSVLDISAAKAAYFNFIRHVDYSLFPSTLSTRPYSLADTASI